MEPEEPFLPPAPSRDGGVLWPRAIVVVALLAAVGAIIAVFLLARDPSPDTALEDFLSAFEAGDFAGAAALTDGDPDVVAEALEVNVEGLDGASLSAEPEAVEELADDEARATVAMSWDVPEIGEFAYRNRAVRMVQGDDGWRVRWRSAVIHPDLTSDNLRLGTAVVPSERAPVLDRDGDALMEARPVIEVGLIPEQLESRAAAIAAIAASTDADAKALRRAVAAAPPGNFVPAITLREEEFEDVREGLEAIEGVEFGEREQPLAPSHEFARAVLGAVTPVPAEQLEDDPDRFEEGDLAGQWGLQAAFDERLAGTPTRQVLLRRVSDAAGVAALHEVEGERGQPLRTTLDLRAQLAAEAALGGKEGNAALVAIEPSSGDLLAVANRPTDDAFNRAMDGQYPPGSTFKIVTTSALLRGGLDTGEVVDCPQFATVGGRQFQNFEGSAAGLVPFSVDFAESCNTAFVSLEDRLEADALGEEGELFGLGREYELGLPAFTGDVPPGRDTVEEAASMIGQARILVSPMAMAAVAATVVEGRWRQPRLLASDPREAGRRLPADHVAELRELMRLVVTSGTGTLLAYLPGEPIGKSGTAEYGSGDPPPTHAWFVAARDDVAVAVLVEDRPSGGEFAAPVAAEFLERFSTSG